MLKPARKNERVRIMRQRKLGHCHQPQGDIATLLGFVQGRIEANKRLARDNQDNQSEYNKVINEIVSKLCNEHSNISVDSDMLGGMPHLKGFRLSVGNVLAKLYIYGSIERVKEIYPDISESHIKEAIAFAQDFLENACASSESY